MAGEIVAIKIVAALDDPDEEVRDEAVNAADNWEVDAAWPHGDMA